MTVPANTPGLTLGPGIIDVGAFRSDTDPAVVNALGEAQSVFAALGWVASRGTGGREFYNVFYDPDDEHFYGGNAQDPENPHDLGELGAGGNAFNPIAVSGQTSVTADSSAEELTLVAGANVTITTDNTAKEITIAASGSTGYGTIQEEGTPLTQRDTINFVGPNVTATDDAGNGVTTVTITDADTTYTAGDGLDLTGTEFSVDLAANKGLEIVSTELAAKAGTYITLDASGINVDLTAVSGYNGASTQVLTNSTGTIEWAAPTGGSGTSTLQWGEVTVEISASASWGSWGTGTVQFKDDSGANDGSAVSVDNPFPATGIVGSVVCCDMSKSPPRVVSISCEEL